MTLKRKQASAGSLAPHTPPPHPRGADHPGASSLRQNHQRRDHDGPAESQIPKTRFQHHNILSFQFLMNHYKCPHFSHHPTMIGISGLLDGYYFW